MAKATARPDIASRLRAASIHRAKRCEGCAPPHGPKIRELLQAAIKAGFAPTIEGLHLVLVEETGYSRSVGALQKHLHHHDRKLWDDSQRAQRVSAK